MNKSILTKARSALGTFVALTLAVAILVYLGLYLLTNGGIVSSTLKTFHDFFAMFKSAEVFMQQFKAGAEKYDRLEQLEGYALLILAAAPLVVLLSRFIRTNQFRVHVQSREVNGGRCGSLCRCAEPSAVVMNS